jgi:bromodomain-containing factor 1
MKPEKGKTQPTRHTEPRAATQPRRQSTTQARPATVSTPKLKTDVSQGGPPSTPASASTPAFAIPPNGIPQIRRDSAREDGDRPKRPIHPPKNRDLDYSSKPNRKKKLDPEQRFYEEVLSEIKKGKYFAMNQWFMEPVDPVALNIPQYFSVVKKPMDLATMTRKNNEGQYKNSKELEKDMRLIVHNAELFNGEDHDVTKLGRELEKIFKEELSKKDRWMERNYPPEPQDESGSPEREAPETEEESDAEVEEDENEATRALQGRLREEQDKLNTLLGSKKPDLTMIEIQQSMVSMLQRKIVEEKTKLHSEKKPKPKKKPTKSKAKASAVTGSNKKATGGSTTAAKKGSGGTKKAAPKKRTIGALEKAVITDGIMNLADNTLNKAVDIIKEDTNQKVSDSIALVDSRSNEGS